MNDYIHPQWQAILCRNGLAEFETLWDLDIPFLDAPNTSRGGISSVAKYTLHHRNIQHSLIIKRQQNHNTRTWRHPLRGIPTTQKEFINIRRFERLGLETVTPIFFARRLGRKKMRAILVTEYLDNYLSFEKYLQQCASAEDHNLLAKRRALRWTAKWVKRMHRAGIQHNCLYTKHLYISMLPSDAPVRGIDLEKARRQLNARRRLTHDLSSLFRRTTYLTRTDQLRFLFFYYGPDGHRRNSLASWRRIRRAIERKKS